VNKRAGCRKQIKFAALKRFDHVGLKAFRRQPQSIGDCGEPNIAIDASENAAGPTLVASVRDKLKTILAHDPMNSYSQLLARVHA
jgi:hypothetical protein